MERTNTTASDAEIFLGLDRDVALAALDPHALTDPSTVLRHADGNGLFPVLPDAADPYFRMEILTAGGRVPAGFAVAVVLSGRGVLRAADSALEVAAGNTLVVPAASGDWQVDGEARLLVCRAGTTWPPGR